MKNKFILKLFIIIVFITSLCSCMHDELSSASDSTSKVYNSKSLWKEDEKYITKIKEVYAKNADDNYIRNTYGIISWDHAMTMNTFGENYLIVPVIKGNKVTNILEVFREKNKAFFHFSNRDMESNEFFEKIIFTDRSRLLAEPVQYIDNTTARTSTKVLQCRTLILTVGYVEGANGVQTPIEQRKTVCKFVDGPENTSDCLGIVDPFTGECDGGGGGSDGGGYYYPTEEEQEDIKEVCAKIKNAFTNEKFKEKYRELNKPEVFAMDHEKGFYERFPPVGSNLPSGFPVVDGAPCRSGMDLPANQDGIGGLMHIHNDFDCEGNAPIKAPSPKDVKTLLNTFIKQARIYTGSYTNAYSIIVTSQGSYMLRYNSEVWPGTIDADKLKGWDSWYKDSYERLIDTNSLTQENVEKVFAQFLKEKVNIDGLQVYKVSETSSEKIDYDSNNKITTRTECPQ
ncbi:hypothetical protein ACNFU2_17655 [Chryseobacterium sp. PTM-20240506]|uniref:hypothetical protein n=1 Tax=Chryseobacterium sp. PTM-20240506 TaxID=3400631 RepID=UPI003AAACFCB